MDHQTVLGRHEDTNRLDFITSLALTSNTTSCAQLCTTPTHSTTTSPSSLHPSRMTVQPVSGIFVKQEYFEEQSSALSHQQVITDQLPPHQIIETVEYDPNIVVKLEQFDDDTTLSNQQTEYSSNNKQTETLQVTRSVKSEYHSPQNQYNIVDSVKLEVKEEYLDDDGGCTECALKRELDCEIDEQMETSHHQQVTQESTNIIRPLVHSVPDQVPPHQIIETVQYNPNITIKQEQFDDDTTLSNGPSQTEYSSAIATTRSTSSSNFVTVKEELKEEYYDDEHCNACGMKRELDIEEVKNRRSLKRRRSEKMDDEDGLVQVDRDTASEEFGHNEGDQQSGDAVPAENDQVNEGGQVIQHRVDQAIETENNFKCTFPGCDKEFKFKSKFTRHTRIHSGEKPFECSWIGCGKAFSQSGNWRAHLRLHTGERPFACDWPNCGLRFSRKQCLTKHYNRIHNRK